MKPRPPCPLPLFLAGALLLAGGVCYAERLEFEQMRQLKAAGQILSLEHFIPKARDLHPGHVIDAQLVWEGEHNAYVYEIEILDQRGQVWELEFDARSGQLLERHREAEYMKE
jgi:uncharacterized membrane protein YkoI